MAEKKIKYFVLRPGIGVLNTKLDIKWRGNFTEGELFDSVEEANKAIKDIVGDTTTVRYTIYGIMEEFINIHS